MCELMIQYELIVDFEWRATKRERYEAIYTSSKKRIFQNDEK